MRWISHIKIRIILCISALFFAFTCFTYKIYANIYSNNGIEFTIYDNENIHAEDDMNAAMSVAVKIKNKNRYADADVEILANANNTFRVVGSNKYSINIAPMDEVELRFAYLYKGFHILDTRSKPREIHIKANVSEEKIYDYDTYLKMLIDRNNGLVATESIIKEFNNLIEEVESEDNDIVKNKFPIWLIAVIIIIIAIVLLIILYRIYKEYKATHFSLFITILIGLMLITLNIGNATAYGMETFIYGKRYSNTYQGKVHFANLIHNMSYTISYKYNGDNPYEDNAEDSDNDGLTNYEEVFYMSDVNNVDTDGDGLTDYDEVYKLNLSPIDVDTDYNGINDSDEDFDIDGLNNISEIQGIEVEGVIYYSDPSISDTDYDKISDYDEVKGNNIYQFTSNPSSVDTDSDSISDYEEISISIKKNLVKENEDRGKVALNPRNERSNGINFDRDRKFSQELNNSMIESSLYKDNVIIPKISGSVRGIIDEHISVKEEKHIENDETILGKVLNIRNDYNEYITVAFEVKDYADKIECLKVATYKNGKVTILDTEIEGSEIRSSVKDGIVYVVDTTKLVDKVISFRKDNWK